LYQETVKLLKTSEVEKPEMAIKNFQLTNEERERESFNIEQ